jgi:hypothetical protein
MDERRRSMDVQKLAAIEARVKIIEEQMTANAELTAEIHASMELTREIHGWVGNAKGFFAVLGWVGTGIKWTAGVLVAIGVTWAAFWRDK